MIEPLDPVAQVEPVENVGHAQHAEHQEPQPPVLFPGGLEDTLLLTSYVDHVACEVWNDMVKY